MKLYLYLKMLVKSILQQLFAVPAAALYYRAGLRKKGACHLVICDHIGDFLYTMGYVRAFCSQRKIQNLRIIGTGRFRELAGLFPVTGCEYHAVSGHLIHLLCIADRYVSGRQLFRSWDDFYLVEPANGFLEGFDFAGHFPQMNLKSCICCGSLKLRPESPFYVPGQKISDTEYEPPDSCQHGKILLCPFAQTMDYEKAEQLFCELAETLKADHYKVYVNVAEGQTIQTGALRVQAGLRELYESLWQYEAVIGIRSGLSDLAVFSGCKKVIALYPPAYELTAFYDLSQMHAGRQNIFQYELTGNMQQDIQAVLQMNEEGKNYGSASYHCPGGRKRNADETADKK